MAGTGDLSKEIISGIGDSLNSLRQTQQYIIDKLKKLDDKVEIITKESFGGPGSRGQDLDGRLRSVESHVVDINEWRQQQQTDIKGRASRLEVAVFGGVIAIAVKVWEMAYSWGQAMKAKVGQ